MLQEQQQILDYQEKLDKARDRSDSDDFTKDERDELDKELEVDMPEAIKSQLPDYGPSKKLTFSQFLKLLQSCHHQNYRQKQ